MPPNPGTRIEDGIEAQSEGRSEICFHAGIADVQQIHYDVWSALMNVRDERTVDHLRAGIALLKREKSQLLQLIAAAPVGFALLDHNLRFVRINAALKVIDGHLANEHIGQTLREVIPEQAVRSNRYATKCFGTKSQFSTFRSAVFWCTDARVHGSVWQVFTPFVPMVRR